MLEKIAKNNTTANLPAAKNDSSSKCLELGGKGVSERIGRIARVSHEQVRKVEKITLRGTEEQKRKLRTGTKSINEVYREIERKGQRQELLGLSQEINLPKDCKLYLGDFRDKAKEIKDNSIDLIFTDPPYDRKSMPLYEDLSYLAQRVLKVGGSLITFAGTYELPSILNLMMKSGLKYWWMFCVKHSGPHATMFQRGVFANWKPMLWFVKGEKLVEGLESIHDYIQSEAPKKVLHEWEQSTVEAEHVINKLTVQNQIVLDPFLGSGITGIAALKCNRQFIGIEMNSNHFRMAEARIGKFINT